MNRFTVTWWDDALEELAQLWIDGDDRDALSAAMLQIVVSESDRRVEIVGVRRTT